MWVEVPGVLPLFHHHHHRGHHHLKGEVGLAAEHGFYWRPSAAEGWQVRFPAAAAAADAAPTKPPPPRRCPRRPFPSAAPLS